MFTPTVIRERSNGERQVIAEVKRDPEEIRNYCERNGMSIKQTSKWKLEQCNIRVDFERPQNRVISESLRHFSDISVCPASVLGSPKPRNAHERP